MRGNRRVRRTNAASWLQSRQQRAANGKPRNCQAVPGITRMSSEATMQRACRLRKNRQFQYVYHKGKSCACRELVLLHVRNPRLQVGFSVSKKVGDSVTRNRVKRRLREQFRQYMPRLRTGLYVIVARSAAATADSKTLGNSLFYLLRRQGLFRDGEKTGNKE